LERRDPRIQFSLILGEEWLEIVLINKCRALSKKQKKKQKKNFSSLTYGLSTVDPPVFAEELGKGGRVS
jgi:hypothetical protein